MFPPSRTATSYPVPVLAAAVLAAEGVSFLLVGSAALWLHGQPIPVADADVVIEPGGQNLRATRVAAGDGQIQLTCRSIRIVAPSPRSRRS